LKAIESPSLREIFLAIGLDLSLRNRESSPKDPLRTSNLTEEDPTSQIPKALPLLQKYFPGLEVKLIVLSTPE